MNKIFTSLFAAAIGTTTVFAQQAPNASGPRTMPYGKIDMADMSMKACDFEKDANAEVLFDKADTYFDDEFNITRERHKRIKIFNDNGKDAANIRIPFISISHVEYITGIDAETLNLVNGKIEVTKLDKKLLYTETVDKYHSAFVFTFPNVKPGSVIEFKYKWTTIDYENFPDWSFQNKLPTRYSELDTQIPDLLYFRVQSHLKQPFSLYKTSSESKSIGTGSDVTSYSVDIIERGLSNVPSLPDEPFMGSEADNTQSLVYLLNTVKPIGGFVRQHSDTWQKVGYNLGENDDFGGQLKRKLTGEEAIIAKAKAIPAKNDKIAYIFKEVQNTMKWDGTDDWSTNDGTVKAWEKKTGNSAEINLVLYHLLNKAGVEAYPMVVSTREHGRVNPAFTFLYQFNRSVVYIPTSEKTYYILDATGKYNAFNEIPENLLNSTGLYIDKDKKIYETVFVSKDDPARQMVFVTGEIKPEGSMQGTAQLSNYSYSRINNIKKYKTDGEQKYIDYLRNNDNSLKIPSLKFENMEVDTLPLVQNIDFKMELTGSDGNYIYFKPTLFSPLRNNPFLSENRTTDIDFAYRNNFSMIGNYKIPAGYKTDALPKNITMQMPDQSITFRRIIGEQDGTITVRYVMDYKKVFYTKEDYAQLFDFYKKLHEMLAEQVVLKKA